MTEVDDRTIDVVVTKTTTAASRQQPFSPALTALIDDIVAALRTVFDPEIPVNVYDLGLIYRIDPKDHGVVEIDMTLTAPGCPVAGEMLSSVQKAVGTVDGVGEVTVNLVFDPPWDKSRMSEDVQLELGLI
jgi:FeS assembly SUF system protein